MLNRICYQGRLVKDPEIKVTQNNISKLEFTIAWSEKYKDTETKCFLRCIAWRNTAEFISKYFNKGSEITIEGRMVTEQWTDQDGKTQSRNVCIIDKANFCGSKNDGSGSVPANNQPLPSNDGFMNISDNVDDSGLPFNFN